MLYPEKETDVSYRFLYALVDGLPASTCLIGGWAVYYTVRAAYRRDLGADYLGSRDIDFGLRDVTAFKKAERFIEDTLGFRRVSFRYLKHLEYETGRELSEEEARRLPAHDTIPMYIDLILPSADQATSEVLGFAPADEPLLARVFEEKGGMRGVPIGTRRVRVPNPALLLSMKLHSVGDRGTDHKRVKDLCDIAALALYSGEGIGDLARVAGRLCDPARIEKGAKCISSSDMDQAASAAAIPIDRMRRVMDRLGLRPMATDVHGGQER